ncbi:hypothetical protein TNCT_488281 [Trichonephila clavata]|uniref:Uncharacterized protein n=1 Tax=Trichonephila clavata TaxID=2740835 RepID=A0A8X6JAI4_TRICU|nr:hypothetical protein TNCT_488281 [Trichonephila clavata]
MYEFFRRSSFAQIHKELGIFSQTVADWRNYASDVLIDYIVVNTEKLRGGEGKTVEVDESKIGKRKYNRGHFVEGQCKDAVSWLQFTTGRQKHFSALSNHGSTQEQLSYLIAGNLTKG